MVHTEEQILHPGLQQQIEAGRSIVFVQTVEEDRLQTLLENMAEAKGATFWIWQVNTGLVSKQQAIPEAWKPETALDQMLAFAVPALVWMKDLHHHYRPPVLRRLRDLYYRWRGQGCCAMLSGPTREIPVEMEREMGFLLLDMPSSGEISAQIEAWLAVDGYAYKGVLEPARVAATLKGLTQSEILHSLTRLVHQKTEAKGSFRILQEEKRRLIQKSGTLEFIPEVPELKDVGGLEILKDWLVKRKQLMLLEGAEARELSPKGMLLMGVSGCGKSLCVKSVSSAWQLPLYRMEMTRVFSGAHGPAEEAFAGACRLMEEMAPAILWIDEIEMGLCADGSAAVDPTMSRIFAFFLTWMQEKPPGLFVAATANRIDLLPAEMIRKGRFDQVFFVDLPTSGERESIFRIHLSRRGYDPEQFNLEVFVDASAGWNGAEIEQCVVAAITNAKMENRELELRDMYAARKQIVPISTTMEEQVRHIRNWAYERAVRASKEEA